MIFTSIGDTRVLECVTEEGEAGRGGAAGWWLLLTMISYKVVCHRYRCHVHPQEECGARVRLAGVVHVTWRR